MKKTFRVKKLHLFVVLIGFICALTFPGCNHKPNYATQNSPENAGNEIYRLPTRNVS